MKRLFIITALCGAMLSSCTKNYYDCDHDAQQIRLSSEVTLSGTPRAQELIRAGQSLSLFVTPAATPAELLYSNVMLNADGSGGFTYSQNMYYPADGRNVDFFAVHPYQAGAVLGNALDFSVSANQAAEANYLNSDLLHALRTDVARTADAVSLTFSHKLSKIDFVIRTLDGIGLNNLNSVEILGVRPSTTISPLTGAITPAGGTPVNVAAFGVAGSALERAEVAGISAIVVPQTFAAGSALFRITVGTQSYLYTIPSTDQDIVLQGNYRYTMTLTLSSEGIGLTSTVNPWEDGGSIGNGTAEPQ